MASVALRSEEYVGLGVAVAAHIALVGLLLVPRPARMDTVPDRIEVTISDDVGLTSTSPDPAAEAAPDVAPVLGEPVPPDALPEAEPVPEPPRPQPKAESPRPAPRPAQKPAPRPAVKAEPPRPAAKPAPARAPRPAAGPERPAQRSAGASRVGDDFLKGVPGGRSAARSNGPPAQVAGPQVQASLLGAISRALRPHWQGKVPEGADAEKLVTVLRWNLNRDGSLAGPVEFVRQEGRTDANQPQWDRHREQAIRAVQLAAPFDLPEQYYDTWKRVGPIRFDKRLSQ